MIKATARPAVIVGADGAEDSAAGALAVGFPVEAAQVAGADTVAIGDKLIHWKRIKSPRAVTFFVHGLNFKFEKLAGLHSLFPDSDLMSLRLSGHDSDKSIWRQVSRKLWLAEWEEAYLQGAEHAAALKLPYYYVGFSLGGVLPIDWMLATQTNKAFDGMFLFAPALGFTRFSELLSPLFILPKWVSIPSLSEKTYRKSNLTPLAAYKALSDSIAAIQNPQAYLIDIPTRIFMDPLDMLVSFDKVQNFILRNELKQWTIHKVDTSLGVYRSIDHHLIVDENCLGKDQWQKLASIVSNWLRH